MDLFNPIRTRITHIKMQIKLIEGTHYSMNGMYLGEFVEVVLSGSYKTYRFIGATIFRPVDSNGSEFKETVKTDLTVSRI